jgi:imidazoleglycerol-phosphate dehydratase
VTKSRKTNETDIRVSLNLDGSGQYEINTVSLSSITCWRSLHVHGQMDLTIVAKGDLEIDGITTLKMWVGLLGQAALMKALGDTPRYYAFSVTPSFRWMKHSRRVVVDLSGRRYLVYSTREFKVPADR